jgi:hypothetical protein
MAKLINSVIHWSALAGLLLLAVEEVQAAPTLSVQARDALSRVCQGGTGIEANTAQSGILLFDTSGTIPASHDELSSSVRADSFNATGLLLCSTLVVTALDTCNISIFFNLLRQRLDYQLSLVPVRNPGQVLFTTRLEGSAPPACSNPGTISPGQTTLTGAAPNGSAIMTWLDSHGVTHDDSDQDGLSNLAELIRNSNPANNNDPGTQLLITANDRSALQLPQGDTLMLKLHFNPGPQLGRNADYYVWAETRGAVYSYIHPGIFRLNTSGKPVLSARAKAVVLADFPLFATQDLEIGDYTVHFRVVVEGSPIYENSAAITINASQWQFREVSAAAGISHTHGYNPVAFSRDISRDRQLMAAGVAAGDFDRDGWIDLYVTRGSIGANLLYRNLGTGKFQDVALAAGVAITGKENSGATFADFDGDGWLDLLVSGINTTTQPILFHNNRNGTFTDVSEKAGLPVVSQSMGSSFADYDKDGDLDFWLTHWTANTQQKYLWRNNGDGTFTDVSALAGVVAIPLSDYTVNFSDINNDSWPDILAAADFGTSQIYINQQNGTFARRTTPVISDENGMGAAVGDYDNDGDLDWFISSIFDPRGKLEFAGILNFNWGITGNRLYQNQGNGSFSDMTAFAGVRVGGWGWGSCFADFNNDSHLDLFQVNGFSSPDPFTTAPFDADASRLFISTGQGSFAERSLELGIADNQQGRGIVCFDYDRDGDIDIFVANNEQKALLFENQGITNHWLQIKVGGESLNSEAIGARVYVTANGVTQMRELQAGSNFMSQNPVIAYFGLGKSATATTVKVVWPSGAERVVANVAADQVLLIAQ